MKYFLEVLISAAHSMYLSNPALSTVLKDLQLWVSKSYFGFQRSQAYTVMRPAEFSIIASQQHLRSLYCTCLTES